MNLKSYKEVMKERAHINIPKFFLGWAIFLIIFVFTIPILLFTNNFYSILEAYLPNLDLIATVLSWKNGPYDIWKHLYPYPVYNYYGYISQTIINYMLRLNNIDVKILPPCYNLQDLFRKNLLHIPGHAWWHDSLKQLYMAGWVYHFNAIPHDAGRDVGYWMERVYKELYT